MTNGFPDPRPPINLPGERGTGAPPQFEEFFEEGVPTRADDGGGIPVTVLDLYYQQLATNPDAAEQLLSGFYAWTMAQGVVGDPNDPELSREYLREILGMNEAEPPGAAGRIQFPSEAALDVATADLRRQQARTEAFNRARDKWDLLQTTDQLADARRRAATEALIAALPYMVEPGREWAPGFEPGGVGQELGALLGANVPPQRLPTAELPLQELANPPLAAPPGEITAGLNPLL